MNMNALKIRYYIWRIRRAYDKLQQSQRDVFNARNEALWYLDRRLKALSECEYRRWLYCSGLRMQTAGVRSDRPAESPAVTGCVLWNLCR